MRPILLSTPLLALGAMPTAAAAETVSITIPQLKVAEYHRPYIAGWLEPAGGGSARTLFVWYDVKKVGREPGTKWLADLRSWWRKGGRNLKLPADGISGATRAPGTYRIALPADIRPGTYTLHVEAARETGGRELVSVPLTIPNATATGAGTSELGKIIVSPR